MNKKILCAILSVLMLFTAMTSLVGCTQNDSQNSDNGNQSADQGNQTTEESTYRIDFVSNGGGAVEAIVKKAGEEITEPAVPTKDGYVFDGWYESLDNGSTLSDKPFVFAYMPAKSFTLYAQWSEKVVLYTITFESDGGTEVSAIEEKPGEEIEEPLNPIKAGYIFCGWYESSDNGVTLAEKPFVFAYMPARSIKLYAKWVLQSVAGKMYKQSVTRFNWKNEDEKALFLEYSPLSEDDLYKFYESYNFEFTFVNDEQVMVSFMAKGKNTYNLYYGITAENVIKFYEDAEAKKTGTPCKIALLTNQFKLSADRSSVIGLFKHGVSFPNGSSLVVGVDLICTVNGN